MANSVSMANKFLCGRWHAPVFGWLADFATPADPTNRANTLSFGGRTVGDRVSGNHS